MTLMVDTMLILLKMILIYPHADGCRNRVEGLRECIAESRVQSIFNVPCHRRLTPPNLGSSGEKYRPESDAHDDVVETEAVVDVLLAVAVVLLPLCVPVPPSDADKDAAKAGGHHSSQQHQLHPLNDIEGIGVDHRSDPEAKYLHEQVCSFDLWRHDAWGPWVAQRFTFPLVYRGQLFHPL